MTNRNPVLVAILSVITCGIYGIYWYVVTKEEMKKLGAEIPTAWLIIVPFVNLYWLWCWSKGCEKVTNGAWGAAPAFLLNFFIFPVGAALAQSNFNKVAATPPVG